MILAAAYLGDLIHLPLLSFAGCVFCLPSKVIHNARLSAVANFFTFLSASWYCCLCLALSFSELALMNCFIHVSPSFCWDPFLLPFSCTQAGFTSLEECCFHLLSLDDHFFLIRMHLGLQICQGLKLFLQIQSKGTSNFRVLHFVLPNRCFPGLLPNVFLSFTLNSATTISWSLPTSAPLFSLTYISDCCQVPLIVKWSICFLSLLLGVYKVSLWITLCGKSVPKMKRS